MPTGRKLVIVKLGGSALTDKSKFETMKDEVLRNVTDQIRSAIETHGDKIYIVLVHGAGSFGHFQAREFGVRQGGRNDSWLQGFSATRLSVTQLNHFVVSSCVSSSIAAVGLSPFPHTHFSPGASCDDEPDGAALAIVIAESLRWGLFPVLHGDAVLSMAPHRCTILSGDTIVLWLAKHLPSELGVTDVHCVFLTDVDGVFSSFDSETGTPTGMLFHRIVVGPDGSLSIPLTAHSTINKDRADVTGGLKGKLEAASAIAILGIDVFITRAGSSSCLQALCGFKPEVGTQIVLDEA